MLDAIDFGPATRFALGVLESVDGLDVVEIGCGAGELSVFLGLRGASVTGLDIDAERLENARALAARWQVDDRCSFVRCRSEEMALPTSSADLVISRSTLQYVDRPLVLRQCMRVLKPGGSIVLLENLPQNPVIQVYRAVRRLRARTPEQIEYARSIRSYLTFAEIRDWLMPFAVTAQREYRFISAATLGLRLLFRRSAIADELDVTAQRLDDVLFRALPATRRLAAFVVVVGREKR